MLSLGVMAASLRRSGGGGSSYRYFRLYLTQGAADSHVTIAEFQGYDVAAGANLFQGETITASSEGFGYVAANANDGNDSTFWHTADAPTVAAPQWLKVDVGAGNEFVPVQFGIRVRSDSGNFPLDFVFQGSNDNATWDDLITRTDESWSLGERKTFDV